MKRIVAGAVLAFLALFVLASQARAWPDQAPVRATISGPGLEGEVNITDVKTLAVLKLGNLEDFSRPTRPEALEGTYVITRWFGELDGQQFGILHYAPPHGDAQGKVLFEDGPAISPHTPYHNYWYYTYPSGDAALQKVIAQSKAAQAGQAGLVSAVTGTAPITIGQLVPLTVFSLAGVGLIALCLFLIRRRQVKLLSVVLLASALFASANIAEAKGQPECATISGSGIKSTIKITDPEILKGFALTEFQNFQSRLPVSPAVKDEEGYAVTNYFSSDCNSQPFDHWTYYANPEGGLGYVYYDGIVNGWSEYDGKWYRVTPLGQTTMNRLLPELVPAAPKPVEPINSSTFESVWHWSVAGAVLLAAAGIVVTMRHRRNRRIA